MWKIIIIKIIKKAYLPIRSDWLCLVMRYLPSLVYLAGFFWSYLRLRVRYSCREVVVADLIPRKQKKGEVRRGEMIWGLAHRRTYQAANVIVFDRIEIFVSLCIDREVGRQVSFGDPRWID